MSIARMTRLAFVHDRAQAPPVTRPGLRDAPPATAETPAVPDAPTGLAAYMETIADYIPTEVVAIYIFAVGVLGTSESLWRWGLLLLGVALVPIFVFLDAPAGASGAWWKFIPLVVMALVAFIAWAAALPDTPFLLITPEATRVGSIAVAVLALLLPPLAKRLQLRPD